MAQLMGQWNLSRKNLLTCLWWRTAETWDTAAASLIVEEAKGTVSDFRGKKYNIYNDNILASNGRIHDQMIKVLRKR